MWTPKFWKDLAERVVASAAGGALAVVVGGQTTSLKPVLIGAGVAAAVSLLKGLIASQKGDPASASLVE